MLFFLMIKEKLWKFIFPCVPVVLSRQLKIIILSIPIRYIRISICQPREDEHDAGGIKAQQIK